MKFTFKTTQSPISASIILEFQAPLEDIPLSAAENLFQALYALQDWSSPKQRLVYSFEIVAQAGFISFRWLIPANQEMTIRRLLGAYWPDFQAKKISHKPLILSKFYLLNFKLKQNSVQPLKDRSSFKAVDPLSYLTAGLIKLEPDEQISYQIVCQPLKTESTKRLNIIANRGLGQLLDIFQLSNHSVDQNLSKSKPVKVALFKANIRLLISGSSRQRLKQHAQTLISALSLFDSQKQGLRAQNLKAQQVYLFRECLLDKPLSLSANELAGLYHLPSFKSTTPEGMPRFLSKTLPPTKTMLNPQARQVVLGDNLHQQNFNSYWPFN